MNVKKDKNCFSGNLEPRAIQEGRVFDILNSQGRVSGKKHGISVCLIITDFNQ